MFEVETKDNSTILYKVKKDGTKVEQARTIQTIDSKILLFKKYKKDSLTFKASSSIRLVASGSNYLAEVKGDIRIYIKPHYQELHKTIMRENYNRYSLAQTRHRQKKQELDRIRLDVDMIIDNMLEYVGTI